jgi:predicted lipase
VKLDKSEALHFTEYVEASNLDSKALINKYPNATYIESHETDTQCFALPLERGSKIDLVVTFRGTEPKLKDWITDIDAFKVVYPYNNFNSKIKVHRGMIKAYKSVRDIIHAVVKPLQERIGVIYVIGHSLGGSLAVLCAVDLQYNFNSVCGPIVCYTYGAPKVGNKAFVTSYNERVKETYRIYLRTDLVPNLPPDWIEKLFGVAYEHSGIPCPIGPWNPIVGIVDMIRRKYTQRFIADVTNHHLSLYKKYLSN